MAKKPLEVEEGVQPPVIVDSIEEDNEAKGRVSLANRVHVDFVEDAEGNEAYVILEHTVPGRAKIIEEGPVAHGHVGMYVDTASVEAGEKLVAFYQGQPVKLFEVKKVVELE